MRLQSSNQFFDRPGGVTDGVESGHALSVEAGIPPRRPATC
jgi:hypothetical protein